MGVRINTNIEALNAQRNLSMTSVNFGKSVEKLSSGLRINRAADDAAGLGISEKLRGQVRGLNQALRNAQDAISLVQTAEGALIEVHAMIQRMRELAVQAVNGTNSQADRDSIALEASTLWAEISRISGATKFNGVALLDGTTTSLVFQIGATAADSLSVSLTAVTQSGLDSGSAIANFASSTAGAVDSADASAAITQLDAALVTVSTARGKYGAIQNRFEYTINSLAVSVENLAASESRIRDLDVAAEMVNFTKAQILQQAGTAILAQANQAPQSVLSLLR
jgi:flagellin